MMALQQQTIELQDSFYLTSMLNDGKPLKLIALILESKIQRRKEQAAQAAQANQEANAAHQQEMQQMKLDFEKMKTQFKFLADKELQQDKYDFIQRNQKSDDITEKEVFGEPVVNNTTNR
jgi:hypothetical protein